MTKPQFFSGQIFFLTCILILCVFLSGIFIGATIGTGVQRELDRIKIEEMTEENLRVLERDENLESALRNALGLRKPTEAIPILRPGTGD
jgi:hypothetical protein